MRYATMLAALIAALFLTAPAAKAQVGVTVNIGPPPVCPYGYYDYAPYDCAPYGYYGPAWFNNGIFIGAGPWYRGNRHFRGWVDRHYDPRFGYSGPMPHRGDRDDWDHGHWRNQPHGDYHDFHGTERRDGRGHEYHGH